MYLRKNNVFNENINMICTDGSEVDFSYCEIDGKPFLLAVLCKLLPLPKLLLPEVVLGVRNVLGGLPSTYLVSWKKAHMEFCRWR